jgi:hypothetical protein
MIQAHMRPINPPAGGTRGYSPRESQGFLGLPVGKYDIYLPLYNVFVLRSKKLSPRFRELLFYFRPKQIPKHITKQTPKKHVSNIIRLPPFFTYRLVLNATLSKI